jgi:hypothetical protein
MARGRLFAREVVAEAMRAYAEEKKRLDRSGVPAAMRGVREIRRRRSESREFSKRSRRACCNGR